MFDLTNTFAPKHKTKKMNKIQFAIYLMALLLCACSEDKKDAPIDPPYEDDFIEEILNKERIYPLDRENINLIGDILQLDDCKILLGQKSYNAWFSKFDSNGNEIYSCEIKPISKCKYSFFDYRSLLYIDDKYLFVRAFFSNVLSDRYEYLRESTLIIDVNTCSQLDIFDSPISNSVYHYYISNSNDRYLIVKNNLDLGDIFYVVGKTGKILYNRAWSENESLFFGNFYEKKDLVIFLDDEIVAPIISNERDFIPYKIINLKSWELVKEIGEYDGLKPFGDRFGQEGIFYSSDTTYLEGNKIKYVYSEKKTIKDEISGSLEYKVLDRYCYDIDIKDYRVSFVGKIK